MAAIELYDYQLDAIEKMHNGCILCGGVGSGKSRTSLAYYFKEQGGCIYTKEYVKKKKKTDMSSSFDVIKRSTGVNIHGILGTAFFNKYKYILDFDKLIAYSKK